MIDGSYRTVERAFELAKTSTCKSVEEIISRLSREGHLNVHDHFQGPTLRKQLLGLIKARIAAERAVRAE